MFNETFLTWIKQGYPMFDLDWMILIFHLTFVKKYKHYQRIQKIAKLLKTIFQLFFLYYSVNQHFVGCELNRKNFCFTLRLISSTYQLSFWYLDCLHLIQSFYFAVQPVVLYHQIDDFRFRITLNQLFDQPGLNLYFLLDPLIRIVLLFRNLKIYVEH